MINCVGMLLAGGEGKRLGKLTNQLAKPAVPFGGKYRIIDFPLSNCTNSGIQTVGVMTQYSPLRLNEHIGNGEPWGLNFKDSGATVLSPYTGQDGGAWYSGTADAIYQNINFIDRFNPKAVLVLSGDHIYTMDYSEMLSHHNETGADATISVMPVPWEEAPRFGILNTEEDLRIYEFEEKPEKPKSNLASMGIYIFDWKTLRQYLIDDAEDENSSHDFGKDIIPAMLGDDKKMYGYKFEGYWKDVGTVESYWEANMDLLEDDLEGLLYNRSWRIYTNESNTPPQYIGETAQIIHSLVNAGCWVDGKIDHSILFENVEVGVGAEIYQSILHPGSTVEQGAILERVIVMEDTAIPEGMVLRAKKDEEPLVIDQEALEKLLA